MVRVRVRVKRNRFIQLSEGTHTVNCELEAKARALAGIKGYVTNLAAYPTAHRSRRVRDRCLSQLFEIEKSFRLSENASQARPIYHRKRDSIEAHLTIVFAAPAVSRWIENQTGWSIRKFDRIHRHTIKH